MSELYNEGNKEQESGMTPQVPAAEETKFSLEDILAEYGQGEPSPAPDPAPTAGTQAPEPEETEDSGKTAAPEHAPDAAGADDAEDLDDEDVRIFRRHKMPDAPKMPQTEAPVREKHAPARDSKVVRFPSFFEDAFPQAEEENAREETPEPPAMTIPEVDDPPTERLKDVMRSTVDAALEDSGDSLLDEPMSWQERVEQMKKTAQEGWKQLEKACRRSDPANWAEPMPQEEPDENEEPEPDLETMFRTHRRECKRLRRQLLLSAVPVAVLLVLTVMDTWFAAYLPPLWNSVLLRCLVLGAVLLLAALLTPELWRAAVRELKEFHLTCAAASGVTVLAVLADCIRGAVTGTMVNLPMAAPAGLFLWMSLLAMLYQADIRRIIYHLADLGGVPPYSLSQTAAGICKQKGRLSGFYNHSQRPDPAERWGRLLLPLLLAADVVFAGMLCLRGSGMKDFLWVWSALLSASLCLGLPLSAILPMHVLAKRLNRSGCAVAGWSGIRSVTSLRRMVLTDADVFPPGTTGMTGLKMYGEDGSRVISYAASVAKASGSILQPAFDRLLASEGSGYEEVQDLRYYEDGGVECLIQGERVIMGSAYCMRSHHISLPTDLKVKVGEFLAVDGKLLAVFVTRYRPSRNVEWALRALRRNRIEMVLGARGANITPGLLKRKFGVDVKPIYPTISTRLILSDLVGERAPTADVLIYREGLMPYAETVIGSRRCCRVVRTGTFFAWLCASVGLFLSFYLIGAGALASMASGYVTAFLLLLLLPIWLLAGMVKYY